MHYKVVCSECRCIGCNKEIRTVICDSCQEKQEMWKRREEESAKI